MGYYYTYGGPISEPGLDGISDGNNIIQGVRNYDPGLGGWTTPDAYAGEVHDPMSQQPYMWNRNNSIVYQDPSGYDNYTGGVNWSSTERIVSAMLFVALLFVPGGPEAKGAESVWDLGWSARGLRIEASLVSHFGESLPARFPVIDAVKMVAGRDTALSITSIKSIDLNAKTYQVASKIGSKLKGYIDSVAGFRLARLGERKVTTNATTERNLVVAIPSGPLTAAQQDALEAAQAYGAQNGINVIYVNVQAI